MVDINSADQKKCKYRSIKLTLALKASEFSKTPSNRYRVIAYEKLALVSTDWEAGRFIKLKHILSSFEGSEDPMGDAIYHLKNGGEIIVPPKTITRKRKRKPKI